MFQMLEAFLVNCFDLLANKVKARHIAAQLGGRVRRQRLVLRPRSAAKRSPALRSLIF
jgi:hypothetical protein